MTQCSSILSQCISKAKKKKTEEEEEKKKKDKEKEKKKRKKETNKQTKKTERNKETKKKEKKKKEEEITFIYSAIILVCTNSLRFYNIPRHFQTLREKTIKSKHKDNGNFYRNRFGQTTSEWQRAIPVTDPEWRKMHGRHSVLTKWKNTILTSRNRQTIRTTHTQTPRKTLATEKGSAHRADDTTVSVSLNGASPHALRTLGRASARAKCSVDVSTSVGHCPPWWLRKQTKFPPVRKWLWCCRRNSRRHRELSRQGAENECEQTTGQWRLGKDGKGRMGRRKGGGGGGHAAKNDGDVGPGQANSYSNIDELVEDA